MLRKILIAILSLLTVTALAVFVFGPGLIEKRLNKVVEHEPYVISDQARALHSTLLVADLHADSLLWNRNLLERSGRGHVDVPRLLAGGVAVQVFSTVTKAPKELNYKENSADSDQITAAIKLQRWPMRTWNSLFERARYQAQKLQTVADDSNGQLMFIRTRGDLQAVLEGRADGKQVAGGLMSTEGSHALGGSIRNIQALYDDGFRMMSLQHFFDNKLGGSLHGQSRAGLTEFGRQAVTEMNRLGIIIDVAHSSEAVVDDVLAMSATPLVVSHTGVKGACDSPRNISDDHMRRIAAAGGLIGIGFWDEAVCDASPSGIARTIAYAIDLIGVDHIALGSDYDGAVTVYFDTSEMAALTHALLNEGLSDAEIRAVMGANQIDFLRKWLPQ